MLGHRNQIKGQHGKAFGDSHWSGQIWHKALIGLVCTTEFWRVFWNTQARLVYQVSCGLRDRPAPHAGFLLPRHKFNSDRALAYLHSGPLVMCSDLHIQVENMFLRDTFLSACRNTKCRYTQPNPGPSRTLWLELHNLE